MSALPLFQPDKPSTKPLREHQLKAMGMLRQTLRSGVRRPVLCLPTGAGKTRTAAEIVNGALAKGNRVAFTVPAVSLIDQTVAAFEGEGIHALGVMQAAHWRTDHRQPVQVVSVQTLGRRQRPDVDVVIVDEAHAQFAAVKAWIKDEPGKVFIGLSATPWARGMADDWQELIVPVTMAELIERGLLAPFRVFAPSHPDMSGVKRGPGGDYAEEGSAEVMGGLVADVVSTWRDKAENRPTLVFAVNRAHAAQLVEQFAGAGIRMGYCDAHTDSVQRALLFRQVERGELAGIVNIGTLTTGVDAPFISCIVLARPTRSEMLHVQIIGRGLRTHPGKTDCCIAEGQRVLTNHGLVPIEQVTIEMQVWDGVEFVKHDGVIFRGEKEVITYAGLTATPDHEVWTPEGKFEQFGVCAEQRLSIAVGGVGRFNVRESEGYIRNARTLERAGCFARAVSGLRRAIAEASLRLGAGAEGAEVALDEVRECEGPLHQSKQSPLCRLWRAGSRVQVQDAERDGTLACRQSGPAQGASDRPGGQSWPLRSGQPPLGDSLGEPAEHPQARAKVYDLLNCGPRHRFTVEGLIVSNCILDHADNHARLGFVTDIRHDKLKAGGEKRAATRKDKGEPMPKECGSCGLLKLPKVRTCPACGFEPTAQSSVETEDGELVEITKAKPKLTQTDKQRLYSELLCIAGERGRSKGWAAHAYREKTGVWPRGLSEQPIVPSPATIAFVRSKDIRFAKRRGA